MEQTVYVDLFFMINFSMDFLCFYLTAKLLGIKMKVYRAVFASVFGGIYANVALALGLSGISAITADAVACALMCLIAFGFMRKLGSLAFYILVYIAVSMTLGGFMTALFNLLNRMGLGNSAGASDGISAWLLALLAIVSAILTLLGGRIFRNKSARRSVNLKISFGNKSKKLRALCDSGNMLREPISGKLCVIATLDAVRDIIPADIVAAVRDGGQRLDNLSLSLTLGVRVIPTRTATGEGILLAVSPDGIVVEDGEREYSVDALLALSELESISEDEDALFPTALLA